MRQTSRLKRIEDKKNTQQGLLFVLLTIGFLALVIFIGSKFFIQIAVLLGDLRSSSSIVDNGDKIPPAPPRFTTSYEATHSATIVLDGYSEPESTVTLMLNGKADKQVLANDSGLFKIEEVELKDGDNVLMVYATDAAGNESSNSRPLNVLFDNEPPSLTITNPTDGDDYYDTEREIIVAGETDKEGVHVRVNGSVVAVDPEGNFVKRLLLVEGENTIEVKAYDNAGNSTKATVKVSYSR